MATETIILRPTGSRVVMGTPTSYPSDVNNSDLWQLVSEETPDDDATYYLIIKSIPVVSCMFTIPDAYRNRIPTSIKLYHRIGGDAVDVSIYISIASEEGSSDYDLRECISTHTTTSDYATYCSEVASDKIELFYDSLLNNEAPSPRYGHVTESYSNGGDSKTTSTVKLTQVYMELTYESDDPGTNDSEEIYIKSNGTWTLMSGTIYQKQAGLWTQVDSSVLQNGSRYAINNQL